MTDLSHGSVTPRPAPPQGKEVAWAFALSFVIAMAATLLGVTGFVLARGAKEPVDVSQVLLFVLLSEGLCVMLGCWLALRRRGAQRLAVLRFVKLSRQELMRSIRIGLLCVLGGALALAAVRLASEGSAARAGIGDLLPGIGVVRFLLVLWAGVYLVPIAEEMLFRGLLFAWLRSRLDFPAAAAASAAAFALAHVMNGVPSAGFAFVLGLVLAHRYEEVRSLWAPIAVHRTVNAAGFAVPWLAS